MNSVAVSMDGSLLLSGSEDQTARVWHVYSRQCLRVLNHRGNMNLLLGLQLKFLLGGHLTITDTSIIPIATTPLGKKVVTLF